MADLTLITRAVDVLRDDDDLRDQILTAGRATRKAALVPAPSPTRLRRIGTAVRELGDVVTRAGAKAEAARKTRRRATVTRGLALGGVGAAAAAAVLSRRQSSSTTDGGTSNV